MRLAKVLFTNCFKGPEPGFEPGTEDPQSHMLPDYTIRAISLGETQYL